MIKCKIGFSKSLVQSIQRTYECYKLITVGMTSVRIPKMIIAVFT